MQCATQVQFICGIPILSARSVLAWLCNGVSASERASLVATVRTLRIDPHLCRLVCLWLTLPESPSGHADSSAAPQRNAAAAGSADSADAALQCTLHQLGFAEEANGSGESACTHEATSVRDGAQVDARRQGGVSSEEESGAAEQWEVVPGCLRDPLDALVHLHRGLLYSLAQLTAEAEALEATGAHRCFVCAYESYDDVVL